MNSVPALVEHPTPVLSILERAIDKGVDVDTMEKLLAMQEREKSNRAREAYNVAMKACQELMPTVVRDRMNTHTKKKYATLESVSESIKPVYTKHGFSLSYGTAQSPKDNHVRIVCDCMHDAGHTQQYQLDCPYDTDGAKGTANKTPIQGMGSAVSYGRRYLKLMIFDVVIEEEDDDGNSGAKVSDEHIATLSEWIESTNTDLPRFLNWMGIEKLADMPVKQFGKALSELKRKAGKK